MTIIQKDRKIIPTKFFLETNESSRILHNWYNASLDWPRDHDEWSDLFKEEFGVYLPTVFPIFFPSQESLDLFIMKYG